MVILSAVSSRKPFLYRLWHLQLMYGDLSKALGMKSIARHVKVADGAQPFQLGDAKMPHWEVGIRLLLLLPINLVMVSSFFLLSFLLMWINDFIRSRQLQSQPSIDKWVIRIWATAFLFAVRAPVSVRDLRPEGDVGGDVYCANHVSVLDPFAIYWHAQAAFLSLTSNRDRPIVGYFCKLAQCFFVERATHSGQGSSSDVIDWLRRTSEVGRAHHDPLPHIFLPMLSADHAHRAALPAVRWRAARLDHAARGAVCAPQPRLHARLRRGTPHARPKRRGVQGPCALCGSRSGVHSGATRHLNLRRL
jgi:hypothetical protein